MPNQPPSLSHAIRSLSASVVALGRTRLELFGIELSEQKENAVRIGVLAAIGLLCLAMAAAVFTAFIA
nr:phage holin family protein [Pseudomonas sp.]